MPYHHPAILEALGWTILNSCWQFGMIWMLVQVLKRIFPELSPALRYKLILAAVLAGVAWSVMSFSLVLSGGISWGAGWDVAGSASWVSKIAALMTGIQGILPWLASIYLAWLFVQLIRFGQHWWQSRGLIEEAGIKVPVDWRLFLEQTAFQMHILRPVQIWFSNRIDSPVIFGWLKPVILLPVSAMTQLSGEQIEALLIHELAHIRRQDYIWNIFITVIDILYYFNPFVHRLVAMIREEREHACDDWVLQLSYTPQTYAGALLVLEQQRSAVRSDLLLAANGNTPSLLLNRVQRMLQLPVSKQKNPGKVFLLTAILTGALGLSLLQPGQQAPMQTAWYTVQPVERVEAAIKIQANSWGLQPSNDQVSVTEKTVTPARIGKPVIGTSSIEANQVTRAAAAGATKDDWEVFNVLTATNGEGEPRVQQADLDQMPEERNYSLMEEDLAKAEQVVPSGQYPYVPKASFEVPTLIDTTFPMAELQAGLATLQAQEAALQTRLALNQLNWEALNARLKEKAHSAAELRQALEQSLATIDWKKVEADASKAANELARMSNAQKAKLSQQLRKAYQQQQLQIEKLQQELETRQKKLKQKTAEKGTIVYF